ncbi:MAG: hypothetical protein KC618_00370, partial [Candidatus Omnitrophica bacterium]|nr:hypothetical protein [Candidatus Omnitrophota bacterium]
MKKILLTICLLIGSSGLAHAETLSLTTTIPAPINTYDRIRIVPSAERLESYCDIGSFYVNENNNLLYKCASLDADGEWVVFGKVWEQNGDLIHLADTVTSPELKRFAIGTSTTELKLKLDNDGGIMAKDTLSIGNAGYTTLPDLGAGTRLLWYPKKAAFRAGRVDGSQWNDSNIGNYSMAFGYNTTASGVAATVGGGQSNSVAGDLGVVGGGQNNSIDSLTWAGTIGGGETNVISNANYAVIGAGADNTISTNTNSVILGGSENLINSGSHNTIAGGVENTISGFHSTIGGGWDNQINGNYGATLGGKDNVAIGNYISMGGGEFNYAEGNHIVIIG